MEPILTALQKIIKNRFLNIRLAMLPVAIWFGWIMTLEETLAAREPALSSSIWVVVCSGHGTNL
jgi:hypothetical protein